VVVLRDGLPAKPSRDIIAIVTLIDDPAIAQVGTDCVTNVDDVVVTVLVKAEIFDALP